MTLVAAACTSKGVSRGAESASDYGSEVADASFAEASAAPTASVHSASSPLASPPPGARETAPAAPPAALQPPSQEAAPNAACPDGMVAVVGTFCTEVRHTCVRPVDKVGRYAGLRCAEFKEPPECKGARVAMRYCIDREEYADDGSDLPKVEVSWTRAAELCAARGARLCTEHEWEFACEGEGMRPYPYGFRRDSMACNIDQTHLGKPEEGLFDLRAKRTDFPACVSPFGVHDMTGNVDEWTVREDGKAPHRSALHGGWWLPGRNGCRPATLFHEESYQGKQVGFRCCGDATSSP